MFRNSVAFSQPGCYRASNQPDCIPLRMIDVARDDLDGDGHVEGAVLLALPVRGWGHWPTYRVVVYSGPPRRLRVLAALDLSRSLNDVEHLSAEAGRLEIRGHYEVRSGCMVDHGDAYSAIFKLRKGRLVEISRKPLPPRPEEEDHYGSKARGTRPPGRSGFLRISTKPPTRVYIDGHDTGLTTPQANISLPAGKHVVRLENPTFKVRHEFRVTVKSGEIARRVFELRRGVD